MKSQRIVDLCTSSPLRLNIYNKRVSCSGGDSDVSFHIEFIIKIKNLACHVPVNKMYMLSMFYTPLLILIISL